MCSTGFHFCVLVTAGHVLVQLFPAAPESVKGQALQAELHPFNVYAALCQTKYVPKATDGHNELKHLYGDTDGHAFRFPTCDDVLHQPK